MSAALHEKADLHMDAASQEPPLLQTLVSALDQNVTTLASRMNLQSEAIVINQCEQNARSEYTYRENRIICYHMAERGVGRSRNAALDYASTRYCLFSDEDIVYRDGYADEVIREFESRPRADVLLFNVEQSEGRQTYRNTDSGRVRWYNYGRYPAYAIGARTASLQEKGLHFSLLFGGGAQYSNGEDSLFLKDCLKAGLRLYRSTVVLGKEEARTSTWFEGYTGKFFFDRGVLYHHLYGRLAYPFGLRFLFANRREMCTEKPFRSYAALLKEGIRHARVSDPDSGDGGAGDTNRS